jgi:type VI secretion system secreted protein VgrG
VGGARVAVSAANISETVKYVGAQTIGCAKLEYTKKQRKLEVKKRHLETVGGMMVLETRGAFAERASESSSYRVAGALTAAAPEVVIEASEKIELRCGGSTITLLPERIEISAATFKLEGATSLTADTKKIEHNC